MSRYLIVIEPTSTGFSAYSSDLPGCVTTGRTLEEVEKEMREAIAFHLDGLRENGLPSRVPPPLTVKSGANQTVHTNAAARNRSPILTFSQKIDVLDHCRYHTPLFRS